MSDNLLKYFEYLRDTSKNISSSGNLHKCLIRKFNKTFKNDVCEVEAKFLEDTIVEKESIIGKSFITHLLQLKKEKNRQVYLGVGYIVGSFNKTVFGSILNIPIKIEQEDYISGKLRISYDLQEISLNYELITALLPDYFISELDDSAQDILHIISLLEEKLKVIDAISSLENIINEFISSLLKTNKNIKIEYLNKNIPFEDISDIKNKESLINKKDYFYKNNKYHIFMAEIPDSISTWKNLDSFCKEIKTKSFNSYVLKEFFSNIFDIEQFEKEEQKEIDYCEIIKNYLPIELSKNQLIALHSCFNSHISYIQGPPGTGKSHTIAGIILASYILGKKVLVVSQKKSALEVVKNKINQFYDENLIVPFLYFNKEDKINLKNSLLSVCNQDLPQKKELDILNLHISKTKQSLKKLNINLNNKYKNLTFLIREYSLYYQKNIEFIKKKEKFLKNPLYSNSSYKKIIALKSNNEKYIKDIKCIENKYIEFQCITKYDYLKINRLESEFNKKFQLKEKIRFYELIKNRLCSIFLEDWFNLSYEMDSNEKFRVNLPETKFVISSRYEIEQIKKEINNLQETLFKQYHKQKMFLSLLNKEENNEIQKFGKMLHWNRGDKVLEKMDQINYTKLLNTFPIWLSEIRNIGEILPNKEEMFDLVIVDESSQVNLAEILPVFYRGKNICVVGDHKQLGLNSSGIMFNLSKKFDKIIWNKYKPSNIDFENANARNLTITKASILDLLRSEENKETFKYILLDEHYRSLPGLSSFNNKEFYNNELKIMTELPDKSLINCFSAIKVDGIKDNKLNQIEAEEIIFIIKYILKKDLIEEKKNIYKEKIKLNKFIPNLPKIGIISSVRDQVDIIKELLEEFSEEDFNQNRLVCGTPEELQGDEFDIVIMSSTTDENSRNNGHYSNENRFNVATSRSKYYTIFVYSNVKKIPLYEKYLNHFGYSNKKIIDKDNILGWTYDKKKNVTEFEIELANFLINYINEINNNKDNVKLFNKIDSCGQKKLNFIIYNSENNKYVVLEPIGISINNIETISYEDSFILRLDNLKKVGWDIIVTSYHLWYKNGELKLNGEKYEKEIARLKNEINKCIF